MPLHIEDFINLIAEICDEKELKVAVTESLKGGLITGISATLAGLLLGPVGLIIGGILGGGASAVAAKGKFRSVASVLKNLTSAQKQLLYEKTIYAFRDFGPQDVVSLSLLLVSQGPCTELAIDVVRNYLNNELSLQIL